MDAPTEHKSGRRRRIGTVLYAVVVGAVAGILLAQTVQPVGLGLGIDTGTPIYLGVIVAVVTMAVDTILRALLDRWPVTAVGHPVDRERRRRRCRLVGAPQHHGRPDLSRDAPIRGARVVARASPLPYSR